MVGATKYQVMTLKHGRGAHTYLKFEYATTAKWKKSCPPAKATGFSITVTPSMSLRQRLVQTPLSNVGAPGEVNDFSTEPLVATRP